MTAVANRVGYPASSAFGFAFHREPGETPGRYFQTADPRLADANDHDRSDHRAKSAPEVGD